VRAWPAVGCVPKYFVLRFAFGQIKRANIHTCIHPRLQVSIALLSSFGGFLVGYDLALVSGAVPFMRSDLNLTSVEVG
jgi:hypothetical protein